MTKNLKDHIKITIEKNSDFLYDEFVKSDTAMRLGIKNEPNDIQWKNIELLVSKILQPVRNKFGSIRITSGFRSPELCLKVGSNASSNHTKGEAADIEPFDTKIKLFDILEWIHNNLDYRELIAEYFPGGWVHVAYREGGNTKQLKLKDSKHNYSIVTLDYIRKIYG